MQERYHLQFLLGKAVLGGVNGKKLQVKPDPLLHKNSSRTHFTRHKHHSLQRLPYIYISSQDYSDIFTTRKKTWRAQIKTNSIDYWALIDLKYKAFSTQLQLLTILLRKSTIWYTTPGSTTDGHKTYLLTVTIYHKLIKYWRNLIL